MNSNRDKSDQTAAEKDSFFVSGNRILGNLIDKQTRCSHYHSTEDIVAIKFKCCNDYYPCYTCHLESAGHRAEVWRKDERMTKAVLCGVCGYEMTVNEYLSSSFCCPNCDAAFNPNCAKHYSLYFEM